MFFFTWEKNVTNARTWFKRPSKPYVDGFPQVFFLKISLYAKGYEQKWKWDVFWVYRNLSCHATWHQRSYLIVLKPALKQGNQNPQACMLFFRLDGTCYSMVELSNSTGWDFDSTIKFNVSTGEEHCEWFVCGVCGTEVAFDIKQVGFTVSSLFFPRPASCSRQFTPNGSHFG